jgi:hypothetical protein
MEIGNGSISQSKITAAPLLGTFAGASVSICAEA